MATMIYKRAPAERNYEVHKGETFYDAFTFKDTVGAAVDLTGWGATFTAWPEASPEGTTPTISLSSGSGITLGGAAGTVVIKVADTVTPTWTARVYDYQFKFEDAAGDSQVYLVGTITVKENIP